MWFVIILFLLILATFLLIGLATGRIVESKKYGKLLNVAERIEFREKDTYKANELRTLRQADYAPFLIGTIFIALYFVAALIFGGMTEVRKYYIDRYRNGEVVEKLRYDYRVIDGERQLTDSTYFYENR